MNYRTPLRCRWRRINIDYLTILGILSILISGCLDLNSSPKSKITGKVILEGESDYGGVRVTLFLPVPLISKRLPVNTSSIGINPSQQTEFDHRLATPISATTTNAQGYFELEKIPSGHYVLVFSKPGFGWRYIFDVSPSCSLSSTHLWKETKVKGDISGHTVWVAHHHYIVEGDVRVTPGGCLIIQPGVWVRFDGYWRIQVEGTLLAEGGDSPITFTTNQGAWSNSSPQKGDWDRIQFESASDQSALRWVRVEWANRGISCVRSSPRIENSVMRHCAESGIATNLFSAPRIENCLITSCGNGVTAETNSAPLIFNNFLLNNENIGIAAKLSSSLRIVNNWIAGNSVGVDISCGATAVITHNVIKDGRQGIKSSQGKNLEINYNVIETQDIAAVSFNNGTSVTSFTNNNVVNNSGWYVCLGGRQMPDVPSSGNWWGTIDRALIAAKIRDGNDVLPGSKENIGEVIFEPFASAPVEGAGLVLPATGQ